MTYQPLVYKRDGGDTLVVKGGGNSGAIFGTTSAAATPAQAATIVDVSTATIAWTTADKAKVNTLILALQNCGILATS